MTEYEESIKKKFKSAAKARTRAKERGDQRYVGDAGYWEGGRCEWGASHNLDEDCHTIAQSLRKIDELKDAKSKLLECTSKEEFNSVKQKLIRIAEEAERNLQIRTGASSSMFGICIIWADFKNFLESQLKVFRERVRKHKEDIEKEDYSGSLELKRLQLEQKQIERQMDENKRKAMNEKDPAKRAALLQLIEDDGKKLKENLNQQKQLPINKLGANFDPDKYKDDLIEAMRKAIEKSVDKSSGDYGNGSGNGGSRRNPRKNDDTENSDDDKNPDDEEDLNDDSDYQKRKKGKKNQPQNFSQQNQQLILIFGIAFLAILYLYSQPSKTKELNYYDF